jgi:ABC-type multidrug transport system fused ATPase/permease subunit
MTAERPAKGVLKEQVPQIEANPIGVSPETVLSAATLLQRKSEEKALTKNDTTPLVQAAADDLRREGIAVTNQDIQSASQSLAESPSGSISQNKTLEIPPKESQAPLPIDVGEYLKAVDDVFRTYQVGKGKWWLMSGIYAGNRAVSNILGGFIARANQREPVWIRAAKGVVEAAKQAGITQGGQLTLANLKNIATNKEVFQTLRNATWPYWGPALYYLTENVTGRFADSLYLQEQTRLQQEVNARITKSILMRDFEFLQNKPVSEMVNIIDRGKSATVELIATTHLDIIPLLADIGSILVRQGIVDRGSQGIAKDRLPLKYTMTSLVNSGLTAWQAWRQAKEFRTITQQERTMWNLANTRLAATLGNLETVRASGGAQEGMKHLASTLEERDYILTGGLWSQKKRSRWLRTAYDMVNNAPYVLEGLDFIRNVQAHPDRPIAEIVEQAIGGGLVAADAKAIGQALQQNIMQFTNAYVYRIIPALEDIKRMNELLGPYDVQDAPSGPKEQMRRGVSTLPNYDIKVHNVSFKDILQNVSLDIPHGSFVTIQGPSGIGKTTLFREMIGLYAPEAGAVTYGGVTVSDIKRFGDDALYAAIAYVNQSPQMMEGMTLRENLLLWTTRDIADERIRSVLRDLRLTHLVDRMDTEVKNLSGGELRRIGIARALLKDPKILFLDEPTANLDRVSTSQVVGIIQELREKRPDMTVVAITHDPIFESLAEKVIDFEKINKPKKIQELGDHQVLEAMAKPQRT